LRELRRLRNLAPMGGPWEVREVDDE